MFLLRCPYGHDSQFTHEDAHIPGKTTSHRYVCGECKRSFVTTLVVIPMVLFGITIDMRSIEECYEEETPTSIANNPRGVHTFSAGDHEYNGSYIEMWTGQGLTMIVAPNAE